jgi:hypothetical protein
LAMSLPLLSPLTRVSQLVLVPAFDVFYSN